LVLKKVGVSQLNKTRGEGSSADWKPKLRREIGVIDFFVLPTGAVFPSDSPEGTGND
jgi:hypothetical protein